MDKMPSTQFRKSYSTLTNPVEVTVNGHIIGVWTPSDGGRLVPLEFAAHVEELNDRWDAGDTPIQQAFRTVGMTQAQRDAILRKVNRHG